MINYGVIAIIAIAVAGLGGFGFGIRYEKGVYAAEEISRKTGWAEALDSTAKEIAKITVVQKTVNRAVEREVQTRTIYADCKNPPEMVELINKAARNEATK